MSFRSIFNTKAPNKSANMKVASAPNAGAALLSSQVLRALDGLALNTDPLLPRQAAGARDGAMRKPASEFREHRPYSPGDDVRYVDWKASARQERIFIKQNADPKAGLIYLLLDCSASMSWGDPPKSATALALAGMLGYLTLANHDRLVVLPVNGLTRPEAARPLGPLWGKGQAAVLDRALRELPFGGQVDIARGLSTLRSRRLSPGGLVLVISDLLGAEDLPRALDALPAPNWKVVVLHLLHPQELDPTIHGYFEMQDIETGLKKEIPVTRKLLEQYHHHLQSWRGRLTQACQERRVTYTMLPTNGSAAQEMSEGMIQRILPELLRARVVKRL
jgi:uncharacterized protein (DUF58 family)